MTLPAARKTLFAVLLMVLSARADAALAHAFPDRSDPKVGAVVSPAPALARIWFDTELESASASLLVQSGNGKRVDKGDGHVDPADHRLLQASLDPLQPGTYRVYWSVLTRDGHRTNGDYSFTVK